MEQSRQESGGGGGGGGQQQNVHLHMHHVCTCQGGLYPSTYYPPVGYRTHVPHMMTYATPQPIARPYLQHYQYTQFNVGGQYTVPISHVSPVGSVYGTSGSQHGVPGEALAAPAAAGGGGGGGRDRKDRLEAAEGGAEADKGQNEPPVGYEYGQITPPANELLVRDNPDSPEITTESFVKFLEKSCLTAEQIAYRNRNRPCFRNIQNLCIRTRSEILKPCTTISNIHSQGIPWATKDFIYAFVRLTNCWHILKGYWENRDGCSLGKIEKELTPEFRSCYVRWEKETIELAAQLTRVFYNLDTNLSNPVPTVNVHTANNLIPPQVSSLKSSSTDHTLKNGGSTAWNDSATSASSATVVTLAGGGGAATSAASAASKNVRGILHLPSAAATPAETADQANQTCSGDFCAAGGGGGGGGREDENETDDEIAQTRVYMKPGSYSVPKKHSVCTSTAPPPAQQQQQQQPAANESSCNANNSPRTIEFFETAQNVNRARELGKKTAAEHKPVRDEAIKVKAVDDSDQQFEVPAQFNVHEWLISSRFSDYGEPSTPPTSPPDLGPFFMDSMFPHHDGLGHLPMNIEPFERAAITLLQRDSKAGKSAATAIAQSKQLNGKVDLGGARASGFRKKSDPRAVGGNKRDKVAFYEEKDGLTPAGLQALEKVLTDINSLDFTCLFTTAKDNFFPVNMEGIQKKIRAKCYDTVNDAVKEIIQCIKSATIFLDSESEKKVEAVIWDLLDQDIPGYDFNELKAECEVASQLIVKSVQYDGDGDH